jgi:hypothetical protein
MVLHAIDQRPPGRPVDDDESARPPAAVSAPHVAINHVVGELHEIGGLGTHDLSMSPGAGRASSDADVAHATLRLHLLERLDVAAPVRQIVDLHQIEALVPQCLRDASI